MADPPREPPNTRTPASRRAQGGVHAERQNELRHKASRANTEHGQAPHRVNRDPMEGTDNEMFSGELALAERPLPASPYLGSPALR